MAKPEYIAAYEEILMGHPFSRVRENKTLKIRKDYPRTCFSSDNTAQENRSNAISILQYAFKDLLGWDAEICKKAISQEVLDMMKLTNIQQYLDVPVEYNGAVDPVFYASLIYPERVTFDREQLALDIYEDVLNEKIVNDRKRSYPKKFFQGQDGKERACLCLIHALQKQSFHNFEEIYSLLADPSKKFLDASKLLLAESEFETPLDYLHDSLSDDDKDDFLYSYYKYKYIYAVYKSKESKEKLHNDRIAKIKDYFAQNTTPNPLLSDLFTSLNIPINSLRELLNELNIEYTDDKKKVKQ